MWGEEGGGGGGVDVDGDPELVSCELVTGGELVVDEVAGTRWGAGGTERPPIVTTELPAPRGSVGPPPPWGQLFSSCSRKPENDEQTSETGSNSEPMER